MEHVVSVLVPLKKANTKEIRHVLEKKPAIVMAKPLVFLGDSHARIMKFPVAARKVTGHELNEVQEGRDPSNWRPMRSVGAGVNEIRISVDGNAFRTIYIVKLNATVYVLHAFQKKTQRTPQQDIELAQKRLKDLRAEIQK